MKTLVYLTTNYIESSKPTNPLQKDFLHQYLPFEGLWSWHAAFWSQLFLPKSHLIPMPSPDFSCASKELDHLPLQQLWMPKKANYPVSKNKTKTTKNPTQKSSFFFLWYNFPANLMSNLEYTSHQDKVSLVSYFVFLYNSLDHGNKNGELWSHLHHHGTQGIHGSAL